jgi:hypothetical protein
MSDPPWLDVTCSEAPDHRAMSDPAWLHVTCGKAPLAAR